MNRTVIILILALARNESTIEWRYFFLFHFFAIESDGIHARCVTFPSHLAGTSYEMTRSTRARLFPRLEAELRIIARALNERIFALSNATVDAALDCCRCVQWRGAARSRDNQPAGRANTEISSPGRHPNAVPRWAPFLLLSLLKETRNVRWKVKQAACACIAHAKQKSARPLAAVGETLNSFCFYFLVRVH